MTPSKVHAAYDGGRLIDNGIFLNSRSMTLSEIQGFLSAKGSVLASRSFLLDCYGANSKERQWYTAVGAPCDQTISSASIIYYAAQIYGINPQVILATLQKEEGLVTSPNPTDWQIDHAMGYDCPTTGNCSDSNFFKQIDSGTWVLRYHYERANGNNTWWNNGGYTCGNASEFYNPGLIPGRNVTFKDQGGVEYRTLYLTNAATASFYCYTPHTYNNPSGLYGLPTYGTTGRYYTGSYNFVINFERWFGSSSTSILIKGSGPTVFVIGSETNVAYGVASGELLRAYGLDSTPITTVSDAYISSLNTSNQLTTLFMQPNDGTYFIADSGRKIGISSGSYCTAWNIPCDQSNAVARLPYAVTSPLSVQPPLSYIMKIGDTNFLMDSGKKRPFPDGTRLDATSWALTNTTNVSSSLNTSQSFGIPAMPDNRFFKIFGNGSIHFCGSNCNRLGITPNYYTFSSFDNFKAWWNGSAVLGDRFSSFNQTPPNSTVLNNFVNVNTSNYLLNGNNRILFTANPSITPISTSTLPELSQITQSKQVIMVDDSKAFQLPGGMIVTIRSNTLRPIPTLTDLALSFTPNNVIPISSSIIDVFPIGKLFVTPGRIFKPIDSPAMYIYGSDGYLWALGSQSELNSSLTWVDNVITAPFSALQYSGIKIYTAMVQIDGNYFATQSDGSLRKLPLNILSNQKDTYVMPLNSPVSSMPVRDNRVINFIRFDNGTIFKIDLDSNSIKPIKNLSTYSSLGGNPSNTTQVSVKSNSAFNIGDPL